MWRIDCEFADLVWHSYWSQWRGRSKNSFVCQHFSSTHVPRCSSSTWKRTSRKVRVSKLNISHCNVLSNWEFTTSRSIAAKAWSGFDTKYMKPLLTHSNPTLMETLPSWCNSMARVLTSTEQLSRHPAMMEESAIEQSYASASAEVQNEDNLNKTNNGVKFPETWMWWSIELLLITITTIIIIYQWYLYTLFTKNQRSDATFLIIMSFSKLLLHPFYVIFIYRIQILWGKYIVIFIKKFLSNTF